MHHTDKHLNLRSTASEGRETHTGAAVEDQPTRNQQAIDLLDRWLADDSGYDERIWPEVKKSIEEHRLGKPTADPQALDGDAILAAQASHISGIIATENVVHLSLFVDAKRWEEL